jgi:NADH:ubiquinone oxidoreductase subunit E
MTTQIIPQDLGQVVQQAIEKHGATREGLIPILSEINRAYGYIPAPAYEEVRRQLNVPGQQLYVSKSQLFALASFYHMLSTEPLGEHVIRFCESAPCHVVGGREVFQAIQDVLQIKAGETTPDGQWSLITTSCLGTCGVGPVMLVDEDIYGNITPEQVSEILAKYK